MSSYIPQVFSKSDPNNSSNTPLTSNTTFTGTSVNVELYASVNISVFTDVSGILQIQFSSDGINWDTNYSFNITANTSFRNIKPVINNYFRVIYTNGISSQSVFRLQSLLNTNEKLETITSNDTITVNTNMLTENMNGNIISPTSKKITSLSSNLNKLNISSNSIPNSAFGDMRVVYPDPVTQLDYVYGINQNVTNTVIVGSGTVTSNNGLASINSGASTNSSATLNSDNILNYRAGCGSDNRFTALFTTGVSGNTQIAGCGNTNDGYFFGYNGTVFSILYRSSASGSTIDTWIPQTSWNVDVMDGSNSTSNKSGMLLDPTKGNVYQIDTAYLGFGNIYWYIMSPEPGLGFILVHVLKYANQNTIQIVRNPSMCLTFSSINTTNTTNITLKSASGAQFITGIKSLNSFYYGYDNLPSGKTLSNAGVWYPIISLRNNNTFGGITNQSQVYFRNISFANGRVNSSMMRFILVINANLTGATYKISPGANSCSNIDIAATAITLPANNQGIFDLSCGAISGINTDLSYMNIFINPGNTITIAANATNGTNNRCYAGFCWTEYI